MQLAMALDASGKNFIWIVRPPIGFDINSEFKANEWLPRGFEERVKGCKKDELCRLKEHIVVKMELVMNKTEKGEAVRMNALKVKEITDNAFTNEENCKGSSVKAMDGFLSAALIMREMK
ncbi:hypothetical protein WN943_009557 [Citrus x changshan-huyou]